MGHVPVGHYVLVFVLSATKQGALFGAFMMLFDGDEDVGSARQIWRGVVFGLAVGAVRVWDVRRAALRPAAPSAERSPVC